jgi:hypothetical protein
MEDVRVSMSLNLRMARREGHQPVDRSSCKVVLRMKRWTRIVNESRDIADEEN